MSVQFVKWFILSFALCAIIAASCRMTTATNTSCPQKYCAEYIDSQANHLFDSLMSLLRWNEADLTKEMSHPTVDKKAFTCLLSYLSYRCAHFAEHYQDVFTTHKFPDAVPDQKIYYIYTLHRIIV